MPDEDSQMQNEFDDPELIGLLRVGSGENQDPESIAA